MMAETSAEAVIRDLLDRLKSEPGTTYHLRVYMNGAGVIVESLEVGNDEYVVDLRAENAYLRDRDNAAQERITALEAIARRVAEMSNDDRGMNICLCSIYDRDTDKHLNQHTPDCYVTLARALLASDASGDTTESLTATPVAVCPHCQTELGMPPRYETNGQVLCGTCGEWFDYPAKE